MLYLARALVKRQRIRAPRPQAASKPLIAMCVQGSDPCTTARRSAHACGSVGLQRLPYAQALW